MGVKRKREELGKGLAAHVPEYYDLRPIQGDRVQDRRWAMFYVMMEWCALKLLFEACDFPLEDLNVHDRRCMYARLDRRTLLMETRCVYSDIEDDEKRARFRQFMQEWNKCIRTNLIAINNTFRNVVQNHDYLHTMRDNFLVPMRAFLREALDIPELLFVVLDDNENGE